MNRIAIVMAAGVVGWAGFAGAATAPSYPPLVSVQPLGQPASSPSGAASGDTSAFTPAPMPDEDASAPHRAPLDPNAPNVQPEMVWANGRSSTQGDGFTSGSAYRGETTAREFKPGPGVNLSVPLQ
jgi:hypothetical protein